MQRTFISCIYVLKPAEMAFGGNLVLVAREVRCISDIGQKSYCREGKAAV